MDRRIFSDFHHGFATFEPDGGSSVAALQINI